jgi:hypothetical protein
MYAQDTSVPVERSKAEIERLITKFGATRFMTGHDAMKAAVAFVIKGKTVQFTLPLPQREEKRFWYTPHRHNKRSEAEAYREWEQACRARWRALCLCIKAKLEAIEAGITTFEAEFLAHFVMHNGQTFGEYAIPMIEEAAKQQRMPQLHLGWNPDISTTERPG